MPAVYKHNSNEHNENLIYKTLPPVSKWYLLYGN